jgi:TRAP-type C4-dicarboxylate transport system substrate-binding protein
MKKVLRILGIAAVVLTVTLSLSPGQVVAAEKVFEFKISIDTAPTHGRNKALVIFNEELQKRSGGKLVPKYFHSGQLYKDAHVAKALRSGTVDMAVPGTWVLEGVDPNMNMFAMPIFFGQPLKNTLAAADGEYGKTASNAVAKKLGAIPLGRLFWVGPSIFCTTKKKVTKLEDMKGLKMRQSGGALQEAQHNVFGCTAIFIAFPDVPMALMQGTMDGVTTNIQAVESSKLYEAGLKYVFEWRAMESMYVPLVSQKFWNSLTPDLQKIFKDLWDEVVDRQREIAMKDVQGFKKMLQSKGMEFFQPSDQELARMRGIYMTLQDKLAKEMKHDPAIVQLAKKGLGM